MYCGVGDYTYELVYYLSKVNQRDEFIINTFDKMTSRYSDVKIKQNSVTSANVISNKQFLEQQGQQQISNNSFVVRRNLGMKMWGNQVIKAVKKDCNLDLIHAQSTTFIYPRMFDTFPLFLGKTPFVVTAHDVPHYRQFHMLPFLRLIYSKATSIITLSNQVTRELERYHGSAIRAKVTVMHHGVDIERFSPNVSPKAFYNWIGRDPASFTIMSFGFLGRGKGTELALRGFQKFVSWHSQNRRDLRFIVAGSSKDGDQNYVNQLKSLIQELSLKDQVVMTGYVPSEMVPSALSSPDLFVYPYFGVSQSGPVHRSIASGKPIIVSNLDGFREIITDGENGLILEKNEPDSIADAFEKLYSNERLRTRMAENSRNYAVEHLDWNKVARETSELYGYILNSKLTKIQT